MAEEGLPEKKDNRKLVYVILAAAAVVFLVIIAIVVVAVAIFFYAGFGPPPDRIVTVCNFPPGISCASYVLRSDAALTLTIGQATGHGITVTGIACSQGSNPPVTWAEKSVVIPNGEMGSLGTVICTTAVGLPATGTQGETAHFKIWINYTETDTAMQRQVVGDMTGRYEP